MAKSGPFFNILTIIYATLSEKIMQPQNAEGLPNTFSDEAVRFTQMKRKCWSAWCIATLTLSNLDIESDDHIIENLVPLSNTLQHHMAQLSCYLMEQRANGSWVHRTRLCFAWTVLVLSKHFHVKEQLEEAGVFVVERLMMSPTLLKDILREFQKGKTDGSQWWCYYDLTPDLETGHWIVAPENKTSDEGKAVPIPPRIRTVMGVFYDVLVAACIRVGVRNVA